MLCAAVLCLSQIAVPNRYADTDRDGLLDRWETEGFGPLDPKVHGCNSNRPDIIIVFRIRSMMEQKTIQPTIDRMRKFYAGMPYKNADGSTGLNLIAIVPPPMAKETDGQGYIELYEKAMPVEWRGLAHGIMVDNSPGGGGQANRPDWCGTGYNWATMLHEVGHQLGLPHTPMSGDTGSPFYPSMMNYDYSYQVNGNIENIQFSTGKFASIRMKETALGEVFPFPKADLEFMTNRPYHFKLKELGPTKTAIDWNRNGVFGERKVRADINDGYSVGLYEGIRMEKSAGAPSLVTDGRRLGMVYGTLPSFEKYEEASLSRGKPGSLALQWLDKEKPGKAISLLKEGVCGDPSALVVGQELWVAYPAADGFVVSRFGLGLGEPKMIEKRDFPGGKLHPTLIQTPHGVVVAVWNEETKGVSLQGLARGEGGPKPLSEVTSQLPVGGVWNSKTKSLGLAVVVHQANFDGCIKILPVTLDGKIGAPLWVGGDKGGARTSAGPIVIFDASKDRGPNGGYNVYVKGQYPTPNQPGVNYCCRQIEDPSLGEGWRIKMMGNEWALSRSVCSAVPFQGDIAYAYRWSWGEQDHAILITRKASGIEDRWVTDFDEVKFIFEHGLQDSLRAVQREQWRRRG